MAYIGANQKKLMDDGCLRRLWWVGFLASVSYIKSIPTIEKIFAAGKSGPKCHFYFFLGLVGLELGSSSVS